MIRFTNGREVRYFVASGALAFDGKGWIWERILVWLGFIKPQLFAVVLKSLTLNPREGNLRWWCPWRCVRLIPGGAVNKVGLTNKGFEWWIKNIAPRLQWRNQQIVVSLYGTEEEILKMLLRLNDFTFITATELNVSCPNAAAKQQTEAIILTVRLARFHSVHPFILKIGYGQDYLTLEAALRDSIEAISINSVPWEVVFPGKRSPLWKLEAKFGGGGGGVSGRPAQAFNWPIVRELVQKGKTPVIAPDIMSYEDVLQAREMGAAAVSFGTIHLPDYRWWKIWTWFTNPCRPTRIVRKDQRRMRQERNSNSLEVLDW